MPLPQVLSDALDASISQFQADHGQFPAKILVGQHSREATLLLNGISDNGWSGYQHDAAGEIPVEARDSRNAPFNTPVESRVIDTNGTTAPIGRVHFDQVAQIYLASDDEATLDACIPYERSGT